MGSADGAPGAPQLSTASPVTGAAGRGRSGVGIHRPGPWPGRRGSPPSSLRACWSFVAQGEALAWEGQAGNTLPSCPCEEEPASPHPARLPCPQVEPPRPPSAGCSSPSAQGSGRPARAKPGARRLEALLAAHIVPPCFVRPGLACPSPALLGFPLVTQIKYVPTNPQLRLGFRGKEGSSRKCGWAIRFPPRPPDHTAARPLPMPSWNPVIQGFFSFLS